MADMSQKEIQERLASLDIQIATVREIFETADEDMRWALKRIDEIDQERHELMKAAAQAKVA